MAELRFAEEPSGRSSHAMKERPSKQLKLVPATSRRNGSARAQAVRLTERGLKTILDAATEGYWSWDIPGGKAFFSEQWLELVGFSAPKKNRPGEFLKSLIHPDDLAQYESGLEAHLAGRTEALDCECRLLTKAGDYRCARLRGRVVRRDKEGHPLQMVGTVVDRSDYKQAHEELEESHTQLSAIFEAAEEMIWVVDPKKFRLLTFNKRVDEVIFNARGFHPRRDMSPEEISPQEADAWKLFYRKVLEKGNFETEYRFNYVPNVLHLISKCLVRDGKVFGICVIGQDVTERRQMEEALRKSEEKFSKAFLDSPMALMLTSLRDHRYMEVNEAFVNATGYERDEVIGKTPLDLDIWVNPEQRVQLIELMEEQGSYRGVEFAWRSKSGVIREALGSAAKIEIDDEPCMLSVAVDISEGKQAREALRESEERLRMAIDSGPWYPFEWDPKTGEVRRSEKSMEILDFGSRAGKLSKSEFIARVHPEDRQKYLKAIRELSEEHPGYKVVFRFVRDDETVIWLEETGRAFFGPDEKIRKVVGMVLDVTETRETERALRDLSGRLITAQEEERRRIARELHDHIGQELALLCAQAQRVDSGISEQENTARADTHELYRKIKDIAVDVSKLSHRLHSSELDFLGLAAAADRLCRDFASQHRIDIDYQISDIPPRLDRGISLCFYRVLQESLQNVAKHSHATRLVVELSGIGNELKLKVVDNGIGFVLANVRFGAGLGLLSMRERLNLVGGFLEISSGEGHGTTVTARVAIPVAATQKN
jgi:PAS domain S-box-containing protein